MYELFASILKTQKLLSEPWSAKVTKPGPRFTKDLKIYLKII